MTAPTSEQAILCIDTTTPYLMVGVWKQGRMLFKHKEPGVSHRYHSAILIPVIQQGLTRARLKPEDLDALAINLGPGSFTGIRTGVSAIRTMAQFLAKPVYAFNTFELIAGSDPEVAWTICLDALQGNIYHGALSFNAEGPVYPTEPTLLPLTDRPEPLPGSEIVISETLKPQFLDHPFHKTFESLDLYTPDIMLSLAQRYPRHFVKTWEEVLPLYLQQPNITQRKPKKGTLK